MRKIAIILTLLAVSSVLLVSRSYGYDAVSVPNWVNFQGFLTDATGAPVADGSYNVDFYIYNDSIAGTELWTETTTQSTAGGRFTHQLGSVNEIYYGLFSYEDSLYLEIVVEGEVISPRTLITSAAFSQVSGGLEMQGCCTLPGVAGIDTDPDQYTLNIYSDDGDIRARLGYYDHGTFELYDSGNNLQFSFDTDVAGDGSAILPNNAISSPEIMDEPGIASTFSDVLNSLTTTPTAYDTVSINAPTSGYVVVTAHAYLNFIHTNGTSDIIRVSISENASALDVSNFAIETWHSSLPTGSLNQFSTIALTKVEAVSAGTQTYYLVADEFTGNAELRRRRLTTMFFPTSYGTVVSTVAGTAGLGGLTAANQADLSGTGYESKVEVITVEEHNARLAAEVAQLKAEMQSRLEKLERRVNQKESGTPQK